MITRRGSTNFGFFLSLSFVLWAIFAIQIDGHAQDAIPKPPATPPPVPRETEEIIHVDSDLVMVPVTVLDRDGRYITNLTKDDFQVLDEGIAQEVAFFEAIETPVTVFLLLDTSASMSEHMLELANAANKFLNNLRPNDYIIAAQFCGTYKIVQDLALVNDIRGKKSLVLKNCGWTRLYDAVYFTFKKLNKIRGRKAVVLFSDGADAGINITYPAEFVTEKDNYKTAKESDSLVYTIKFDTSSQTECPCKRNDRRCRECKKDIVTANRYMKTLPELTGGRHLKIAQVADLAEAFTEIANELRQQYSLGYYPKNKGKAGERREIKVRVNRPGLAVRARDSYVVGKRKSK